MATTATRTNHGNAEFTCGFVRPDIAVLGGEAQSPELVIEFEFASVSPELARGERLLIDGATYRVRGQPRRDADGFFAKADLESVQP